MSEFEEQTIEILNKENAKLREQSTLRDQFAMAALTGRLAIDAHPQSFGPTDAIEAAQDAYKYADAMMKARNTSNKEGE